MSRANKAQKSTYQSCSQYSVIQVYQYKYQYLSLKYQYQYKYLKMVLKYRSSTSTSTQYYNPGTYSGESFVKDNSANRRLEFYLRGRCAATMLLGIGLRTFGVHRRAIFTECVLIMFACALLLLMLAS